MCQRAPVFHEPWRMRDCDSNLNDVPWCAWGIEGEVWRGEGPRLSSTRFVLRPAADLRKPEKPEPR
jgi:hypothetical protein